VRFERSVRRGQGGAEAPPIRRYLLAFLSVLTAVPVLWLGHAHATRVAERDRRRHDESLASLAEAVTGQLGTMIESRCRDLEVLAGHLEVLGERSGPRVEALLREHWERSRYYTAMYIGDAAGTAVVRAPLKPSDPGHAASSRERDYYQTLVATRRTAMSRVQRGVWLDSVSVQIAAPVFDPGAELVGYVEGSLELDSFAVLVKRYAARVPGSRVVVLDAGSRVVADSASDENAGTDRLAGAPLFRTPVPKGHLASAGDERGKTMRAAFEPAGTLLPGWRVVAAESQQSIDDNARELRNETWTAAVIVWLLVFVVAGAVASRFGRRLKELADTVIAIGEGNFGRRPEPAGRFEPRELAVLGTQIGAMAERFDRHTRDLEAEVNARTSELGRVNARLTLLVNALERADDGIEITDPDARFIYVNPAFERITGYSMTEVVGKTPAILRSGTYDVELYERIWKRINSGKVYSGTFAGRRKDGALFDQELAVWPIQGESGEITHFVGLRRDVSERRRTEQALRVSERMASLGTLAAGVAHEINNPLTYVLLNLRFLREQADTSGNVPESGRERVKVAIARALEGAERVNAIVKDLRMLSHPNDRSVKALDLRALLESALRMVGNDIRHRARLFCRFEPVPDVMGNEAQLGQVFLNLLVNAVQALDGRAVAQSEIGVRTYTDELGRAVVEISDTGSGIPAEHLPRIFDPFFTTKPVGLGTGIGLSICHGTVKAMRGEILVESSVGKGSVFRVLLPPAPSETPQLSSDGVAGCARRPLAPQQVLVMDDDRAVAEALEQALSGHQVTLVGSADEGLAAVRNTRFDTLLCDIMMPGMTGIEFYERLDIAERRKVVFITGGVLTEQARRFLEEQNVPCLEKPVSIEDLEAALSRTIEDDHAPLRHDLGPAA
jgi:PAS domain S-box-containing protein